MGEFLKAKTKRFNSNTFLFIITIVLFIAMYVAGMIVFADKGFAKPHSNHNFLYPFDTFQHLKILSTSVFSVSIFFFSFFIKIHLIFSYFHTQKV